MEKKYDVMVIGPVSIDYNIDYQGNERREIGGAVVASGFAAAGSGVRTAVFCKSNEKDADIKERFAGIQADLYWSPSSATCSIRNQYFTADKEKRQCTSLGGCDPFRFAEIPRWRQRCTISQVWYMGILTALCLKKPHNTEKWLWMYSACSVMWNRTVP